MSQAQPAPQGNAIRPPSANKRRWRRIGIILALAALVAIGWQVWLTESCRSEIAIAESEIQKRQWLIARQRLERVLDSPRIWRSQDNAAYYWLGVCDSMLKRREPALES